MEIFLFHFFFDIFRNLFTERLYISFKTGLDDFLKKFGTIRASETEICYESVMLIVHDRIACVKIGSSVYRMSQKMMNFPLRC